MSRSITSDRRSAALLLVGRDVRQLTQLAQPREHARRPGLQLGGVRVLDGVLVLGPTLAALNLQVLRRLQEHLHVRDLPELRAEARDDVGRRWRRAPCAASA